MINHDVGEVSHFLLEMLTRRLFKFKGLKSNENLTENPNIVQKITNVQSFQTQSVQPHSINSRFLSAHL